MFVNLFAGYSRITGVSPEKREEKKDLTRLFYLCFICASVGSIVRIIYLIRYPAQVRDAFTYREFIEQWIEFGDFPQTSTLPPLGLYFIKVSQSFFEGNIFAGGVALNMVLGLCIICLAMIISSKIYPSAVLTVCVGILAATHPTLVHYSCQMLRENSFLFFSGLSIVFFLNYIKTLHPQNIFATSCFITSACLCRYEAFEISVILFALIFLNWKANCWAKIRHALIFVSGCALSFLIISFVTRIPLSYYSNAIQEEISVKSMDDTF